MLFPNKTKKQAVCTYKKKRVRTARLYRRTTEIYRSGMRILLRMQEEKKKRMESEKLRATKRNTYSNILHGDGVSGKIRLYQRKV